MSAVVLFVELTLHRGKRAAYVARAQRHREKVLAQEPGCEAFDILVPDEADDTVFLHEVYADEAALEHHANTPYMQAYREDTAPMVVERKRTRCARQNG